MVVLLFFNRINKSNFVTVLLFITTGEGDYNTVLLGQKRVFDRNNTTRSKKCPVL